jgi:hypothetical protein
MCFELSNTTFWRRARGHPIPIYALALVYAVLIGTLVGCYVMASNNGHLDRYDGSLPPISALGANFPEQALFITGFTVSSLCLFIVVLYRSSWIDEAYPGSRINNFLFVLAIVGLPNMIVMSSVSMVFYFSFFPVLLFSWNFLTSKRCIELCLFVFCFIFLI